MPNLGLPELIVLVFILAFTVVPLAVCVLALVDIGKRTDPQFLAAGQNRTTWTILAFVGIFVPCVFLASAYYLLAVRPRLPARDPA